MWNTKYVNKCLIRVPAGTDKRTEKKPIISSNKFSAPFPILLLGLAKCAYCLA